MDTNNIQIAGASVDPGPIRIEAAQRLKADNSIYEAEAAEPVPELANDSFAMPMDSKYTRTGD